MKTIKRKVIWVSEFHCTKCGRITSQHHLSKQKAESYNPQGAQGGWTFKGDEVECPWCGYERREIERKCASVVKDFDRF